MRIEPAVSVPSVAGDEVRRRRPRRCRRSTRRRSRSVSHGLRAGPKCGLVVERAEGELVRVQLAEHDRARRAQPRDHRRVARSATLSREHLRRRGRPRARDVDHVLDARSGRRAAAPRGPAARRPPRAPPPRARVMYAFSRGPPRSARGTSSTASRGESSPARSRARQRRRALTAAGTSRPQLLELARAPGGSPRGSRHAPRGPRRSARRPDARPARGAREGGSGRLAVHADLRVPLQDVRRAVRGVPLDLDEARAAVPEVRRRRASSGCSRRSTPSGSRATSPGTASAAAGTEPHRPSPARISQTLAPCQGGPMPYAEIDDGSGSTTS